MVSIRKKRLQNRHFFSHLNEFDQKVLSGDAVSSWQQSVEFNDGSVDREFTFSINDGIHTTSEKTVKVQTHQKTCTDRTDIELGITLGMVEDRIQNATLTAMDKMVNPWIELAVKSTNACSGQNAVDRTVNLERGEHTGITASLENVSDRDNTSPEISTNDETGGHVTDEVRELSGPRTNLDRQPRAYHSETAIASVKTTQSWKKRVWIYSNRLSQRIIFAGKGKISTRRPVRTGSLRDIFFL